MIFEDIKEFEDEVLLDIYKNAVEDLPGGGAYARAKYYEVYEELLRRLKE